MHGQVHLLAGGWKEGDMRLVEVIPVLGNATDLNAIALDAAAHVLDRECEDNLIAEPHLCGFWYDYKTHCLVHSRSPPLLRPLNQIGARRAVKYVTPITARARSAPA